jgi:putative salt-induced outer membrane protein YdiY
MQTRFARGHTLLVILGSLLALPALAAKTDVVRLVNGDDVTGEVKELDFGTLSYGTDSMGTVKIDWEDVVTVTSNQSLQVELDDGRRYFGSLVEPDGEHQLQIRTGGGDVSFATQQIVRITPIDNEVSFLERLDGSASLGFQSQKSNDTRTSNVAVDVSYRELKYLVGLRLNSTVTDQSDQEATARQSLALNLQRFRANRWFADWFAGWERNDELGIEARVSAGVAWGRYIVQNNRNLFSVTAGAQLARERYYGQDPNDTVAEGRIEIRYLHRNLDPERSFTITSTVYPLLSDFSNYRAETDLSFKQEFLEDFYLELSIGQSYLSSPPSGGAKSDYAVTTSLGYDF